MGPTAVGKTAFAIQLAHALQTKIISADSRQCYRELNIGVAKPNDKELNEVHHYFINSHSILEELHVRSFEQYALQAVNEIFQNSDVAVMVGGTGLYIKTFCEGIDEIPAINNDVRSNIIDKYNQLGLTWLQEEVKQKDPAFWQVAEQQNPQRLMRALEIKNQTGNSILDYRNRKMVDRDFNIVKIGLELPREILYTRINNRVELMMQLGLLQEAASLVAYKKLNALQTVGYKELFDYFEGSITLEKAVDLIKQNSRHYAKRQLTWFKKDRAITWFNADLNNLLQQVLLHFDIKI